MKDESVAITGDRRVLRLLSLLGALMLGAGALCTVAAVMEVAAYALFAEGGRFHYEGYAPGGVIFALITLSLLAYAGLAAILLSLGYGHLRRLAWSVLAAEALAWTWLVIGLPLLAGAVLLTLMSKSPFGAGGFALLGVAILLAYPVAPVALLLLYRRARASGGLRGNVSAAPGLPARGTAALLAALAALALLPILLRSPFPWFGRMITGAAGLAVLLAAAMGLCAAAWGVLRGRAWGWWTGIALLALLCASATVTAARMTVGEMIAALGLAAEEAKLFSQMPFLPVHPVAATLAALGVLMAVLLATRRASGRSSPRRVQ